MGCDRFTGKRCGSMSRAGTTNGRRTRTGGDRTLSTAVLYWTLRSRSARGGSLRPYTTIHLILAMFAAPAAAQTGPRLAGRVVERGGDAGIAGATIEASGQRAITDITGRFGFEGLGAGPVHLRITAFGYADREIEIVLRADTTVKIELDPSPVPLDALMVEDRAITVRGRVQESGSDLGLIDVEIRIEPDHETLTSTAGRFSIDDVPAGPPLRMSVRGFGYLPIESIVSAFEDTTLVIHLEPDPVMQRMIAEQVTRLEERGRPFNTAVMPAMDREYLLRNRGGTALDLIRFRYGPLLRRLKCILIDDRQSYNGLDELNHFVPEELERIEVLKGGAMLRIYTRDYIRDMVGGGVELAMPVYLEFSRPPFCR